ncbi:hypothetical protein PISMIDRAFT_121349, partial [Pisolithus microcarpus 441]
APQLQLPEQWCLDGDDEKFCCKLCIDPNVFSSIVCWIKNHPIFYDNLNNPQLPVEIQLAIFLNSAGHYGNAVMTEDAAEWVGVCVGMVYNCFWCIMIATLQHHDNCIHFDPLEGNDQEEHEHVKQWVEDQMGIPEWQHGFLCIDGSPLNLFQKPGWHGEGFYDHKSHYSISSQVSTNLLHLLIGHSPRPGHHPAS